MIIQSTSDKVLKALESLRKGSKPITVAGVAKKAGIERKTIYNNPALLQRIKQVKEIQGNKKKQQSVEKAKSSSIQEQRIKRLRDEIAKLSFEKAKVLHQNMLLTEEKLLLQRRVFELEETIRNIESGKVKPLISTKN
ncbi:DUF6262 family protein [Bacillus thuringiensis]|nr:DUF6262 family protein [Bacillus thuringiensis]